MTEILIGPYEPDSATIGTNKTGFVRNVLPRADGFGPFPGIGPISNPLPARCVGFKSGFAANGAPYVIAGTSTALYRLNATTHAWDNVSISGGYTLQPTDYWSFDQFGDNIIAVGGANVVPQTLAMSSGTLFANLGGSPPRAKHVAIVGDFVVLSGLTDNPGRIQWSGINDSTWWTPDPDRLSDWQDFPDGGSVQGVAGGEFGIVFQDSAIRQMTFAPGSAEIFQFNRISKDRGIYQPLSLAQVQSASFFLGSDGFYRIDPGGALTPIGNTKVNRTFLSDADLGNPLYTIAAADVNSTRVFWAYRSLNAAGQTGLDKVLIYDWALDKWSYAEIGLEWIGQGSLPATTLESLDSISTNLDILPSSLDSYVVNALPKFAAFTDSHIFGFWAGAPLEATLETAEGTLGDGVRVFIRNVGPLGDAADVAVSVLSRERLTDTQKISNEAAINVRGYCPLRASGRYHAARIRVPAASSWSYVRGVDVDLSKSGFR
jgi:hypothetical protein